MFVLLSFSHRMVKPHFRYLPFHPSLNSPHLLLSNVCRYLARAWPVTRQLNTLWPA
jgi:hypothetical protein